MIKPNSSLVLTVDVIYIMMTWIPRLVNALKHAGWQGQFGYNKICINTITPNAFIFQDNWFGDSYYNFKYADYFYCFADDIFQNDYTLKSDWQCYL